MSHFNPDTRLALPLLWKACFSKGPQGCKNNMGYIFLVEALGQEVCKKESATWGCFIWLRSPRPPPSFRLPKKEINHVFMCQAQLSYGTICYLLSENSKKKTYRWSENSIHAFCGRSVVDMVLKWCWYVSYKCQNLPISFMAFFGFFQHQCLPFICHHNLLQ